MPIDLYRAARGNTSLESAISLTKELRWEIQALGVRLSNAANEEELLNRKSSRAKSQEQNDLSLRLIVADVRRLLVRIEDAVPLINLAITTSGVSLSTTLPSSVSPSRLLQASTFLTAADTQYVTSRAPTVQVGPTYTLSMYMLFAGHAWRPQDDEDIRETTWKEVLHKARVKLVRVPLDSLYDIPDQHTEGGDTSKGPNHSIRGDEAALEFAYQIQLVEDLDDDRVHTYDDGEPQPGPFDGVAIAGIRDWIPVHQISKIFYADTGKILNIGSDGETNSPVLLLKRDVHAEPPRRMMERQHTEGLMSEQDINEQAEPTADFGSSASAPDDDDVERQIRRESTALSSSSPKAAPLLNAGWQLPPDLDPEWIAFEVYNEDPDSDEDFDGQAENAHEELSGDVIRHKSVDSDVANALSKLKVGVETPSQGTTDTHRSQSRASPVRQAAIPPVRTSLSLFEMLIRLTALQQFRQSSHLTIEDELLNFFLEDSSTTGAGPNAEYRQRVRRDARRRVGFDPYDESPIKRRGEEYLAHPRASPWRDLGPEYDDHYGREETFDENDVKPSIEFYRSRRQTPDVRSSPSPFVRPSPRSAKSSPGPRMSSAGGSPLSNRNVRKDYLRARSEMPKSPLAQNVATPKRDSTLGTSPTSQEIPGESA